MYQFNSRVRFSEVGVDRKIKMESVLDYFQDVSTLQSEDLGLGLAYLQPKGLAWVLSSWQVIFHRYPELGEEIVAATFPYEFKGFMGMRNFMLQTSSGEMLACANSVWTLINLEKLVPEKADAKMLESYVLEPKLDMEYAPRKIKRPEVYTQKEPIVVQVHHLDTNNHVNNVQYLRLAAAYLQEGCKIKQLRAEYRKSAKLGDIMIPCVSVDENNKTITVVLDGEDGAPYCLVELMTD